MFTTNKKKKFIHRKIQQKAKLTACEYNEGTSDSSPEFKGPFTLLEKFSHSTTTLE